MLYINGLVQEKCNSIANALDLRLSCTNPLICCLLTLAEIILTETETTGSWFNRLKKPSYQYKNSHPGNEITWQLFHLHNGMEKSKATFVSTVGFDIIRLTLQWRHNGCDGISNHQHYHCLLNCLFRCRSKTILKLCVTGLLQGRECTSDQWITLTNGH